MRHPSSVVSQAYGDFDSQIRRGLSELRQTFKSEPDDADFVSNQTATRFILAWMGDHFRYSKQFDALIGRQKMPGTADQFTGVVVATLGAFLSARGCPAVVKSEVALERKRGSIYPDISVWTNEGELTAIIECKTNLGYNRSGWADQYAKRTAIAQALSSGAESYLCILTSMNWNSDPYTESPLRSTHWYCLTDLWPLELAAPCDTQVLDPIEPMLLGILERYSARTR